MYCLGFQIVLLLNVLWIEQMKISKTCIFRCRYVEPCGLQRNGQEPRYLCADFLRCGTGGHIDQEVKSKNKSAVGKYQWAATLVVKKQNGSSHSHFTGVQQLKDRGWVGSTSVYTGTLIIIASLWKRSPHCGLGLQPASVGETTASFWCVSLNCRCLTDTENLARSPKDLVVFYLKFYSKTRWCFLSMRTHSKLHVCDL